MERSNVMRTSAPRANPASESNRKTRSFLSNRWNASLCAWCASWTISDPSNALTAENLLYLEAWRAVDRAYVDAPALGATWRKEKDNVLKNRKMSTRDETYSAIRNSLSLLGDPFTRVVEPKRFAAMRSANRQGQVAGVGVQLSSEASGDVVVIKVNRDGPAEKAGVSPGDQLLSVNGRKLGDVPLADVGDLLRGDPGTKVELQIGKKDGKGSLKVMDLQLERANVTLQPVESLTCNNKVAYVHIAAFQSDASAREGLKQAVEQGAKAIVIDLRGNTGGSFPAGVELARDLLSSGEIVRVADAKGVRDILDADYPHPLLVPSSFPITILVDKGTASAAEVFAAALHDNGRASVVGSNTYGKARVQTIVELSDGGAVLVSTAKYLTPSGADIQGVGLVPDKQLPAGFPEDPQGFCAAMEGLAADTLFVRQDVPHFDEGKVL